MEPEPPKSDAPEVSNSIIASAKRWPLLKKFQSEKVPYEREKGRGKGDLFSISTSTGTGESPGLSSSPGKVRKMKGTFRLAEDRRSSTEFGKGNVKPKSASHPLLNEVAVGVVNASNAGGAMRKMLEGLHNTRTRLEQNQRSYEKTRRSIEELDKQTSHVRKDYQNVAGKWNELTEKAAVIMTELTCLEISDQVLGGTLMKTEDELSNDLEELFKIRMETSQMSSDYLREAISSGMLWNGTAEGHQNRMRHWEEEFENVDRYKQQLEQELSDFLALLKVVEDSMRTRDEEAKKMEEQEVVLIKQEREIQERVKELDTTLNGLIREEKEFVESSEEECEKLRREIEEAQSKMTFLQDKGKEAKTTIKAQKIPIKSPVVEVSQAKESQHQTAARPEIEIVHFEPSTNDPTDKKTHEGKGFKFQAPAKSQLSFSSATAMEINDSQLDDDDEDICMAAATEVSQSIRTYDYEPLTPMPIYPPASNVRVVERQVPLTGFMRQLSSAKVIKRHPKSTASQAKPVQMSAAPVPDAAQTTRPITPSGKHFQFKKKASASSLSSVS